MLTRLQHLWLALTCLPGLLVNGRHRRLLADMRALCRQLPAILQAPLPKALAILNPPTTQPPDYQTTRLPDHQTTRLLDYPTTRRLADLAALLERRSPLGLCLRRSLVRYHFLRRLGMPVVINFGAKFVGGEADRDITGHAWLTLHGRPYHELDENWRGFTVMFTWPDSVSRNP